MNLLMKLEIQKKVYDFKKPLSDKEKEVITKAQLNIVNNYYFNNQ